MVSGGWLAGVKRARMQAWKARPDVDTLISKDKKGKGKARMVDETEGGVTDYHLTPSLVPYDPIVTNQLPRTTQDTVTILRSLKEFLSKPILPAPKPTAKHLLLIVSPFEGHSHDHHSSHTSFKCSFSSGTFSIPTSITEDSGEFVLIGLQDWDGEFDRYYHVPPSTLPL